MCPRADLRLYGKTAAARNGFQSLIHHAQYRGHDIRIIAVDSEHGWHMKVQILCEGKRIARYQEPEQLYLDFSHARIAGLLHAYEIVDKRLGKIPMGASQHIP